MTVRINLKDQLLKSEPQNLIREKENKRKQSGNDEVNYGVPIKKVASHDHDL